MVCAFCGADAGEASVCPGCKRHDAAVRELVDQAERIGANGERLRIATAVSKLRQVRCVAPGEFTDGEPAVLLRDVVLLLNEGH